jgi:orotidine-5'-phosphate decarboxylase
MCGRAYSVISESWFHVQECDLRFIDKLTMQSSLAESLVCVGIDPDPSLMPEHLAGRQHHLYEFNRAIIEATADGACAFKFNSAFFEAAGSRGILALQQSCACVPPRVPIILDFKRGDVFHSAEKYAEYAYDVVGADAVTVNPYLGFDTIRPFLREGKCVFVLALTSNPSAEEFQSLETGDGPLYLAVARAAKRWAEEGDIGLVVGATRPEAIGRIREIAGNMPFLIPGVGAQGGDIAEVIRYSGPSPTNTIINSSRQILYASRERDFAKAAARTLDEVRQHINQYRAMES